MIFLGSLMYETLEIIHEGEIKESGVVVVVVGVKLH
jgi:hypothetical protein